MNVLKSCPSACLWRKNFSLFATSGYFISQWRMTTWKQDGEILSCCVSQFGGWTMRSGVTSSFINSASSGDIMLKKVCCWTTSSSRANFDPIQYPYDLLSHCSIMAMVWPSVSVSGLSPGTAFDLKSCPAVCGGGMGPCVVVVCTWHAAAVPRLCRSLRSFSHCSYFFLVLPASDVSSGSASSIS